MPTFENSWAIVELMGHQVIAGQISEVTIAGAPMLRVDVPAISEDETTVIAAYTKFFGAAAIYAITPVDEPGARYTASQLARRPVDIYIIPTRALPQRDDYDAAYEIDPEPPF